MTVLALAGIAFGQAQSKARVQLGAVLVLPGEVADMPLTLQANGETIIAIENELTLPALLAFVEAAAGQPDQPVGPSMPSIKVEVAPAEQDAKQFKLRVKIEAPDGKPLSDGVIAVLKFRLAAEVPEKDFPIYLSIEDKVTVTNTENRKTDTDASSADVIVMKEPPPITVCFFYMH